MFAHKQNSQSRFLCQASWSIFANSTISISADPVYLIKGALFQEMVLKNEFKLFYI